MELTIKRNIAFLFLLFVTTTKGMFAQEKFWPLDLANEISSYLPDGHPVVYTQSDDAQNSALVHSANTSYGMNRLGQNNKALYFASGSPYIEHQDRFFALQNPSTGTQYNIGESPYETSFSFWMKTGVSENYKAIFYAIDLNDKFSYGMFLRNKDILLRRKTGFNTTEARPWDVRIVETIPEFQAGSEEWYYVNIVYSKLYIRLYIGKYNEELEPDGSRVYPQLGCSFQWIGNYTQDWNSLEFFGFGNNPMDQYQPVNISDQNPITYTHGNVSALDDFKVWGSALSVEEIENQFDTESGRSPRHTVSAPSSAAHDESLGQIGCECLEEENHEPAPFVVYPNPTEDFVSFNVYLKNPDVISAKIINLDGKQFFDKEWKLNTDGNHTLDIQNLKKYGIVQGVYLLEVISKSGEIQERRRIIVQ